MNHIYLFWSNSSVLGFSVWAKPKGTWLPKVKVPNLWLCDEIIQIEIISDFTFWICCLSLYIKFLLSHPKLQVRPFCSILSLLRNYNVVSSCNIILSLIGSSFQNSHIFGCNWIVLFLENMASYKRKLKDLFMIVNTQQSFHCLRNNNFLFIESRPW